MVVTGVLVASCVLMAGLFLVIASWMREQAFRRGALANTAAAVCCLAGGLALPSAEQAVPAVTLLTASLLGVTSLHAVRTGRG